MKIYIFLGYVDDLMAELLLQREVNLSYKRALSLAALENQHQPLPIAETAGQRRPKLDVINAHISRFNR